MPTKTTPIMTVSPKLTYRGLPVAAFAVGDLVPLEPNVFAVQVTPDLAQDWLNRYADPKKRTIRGRKVSQYAYDMEQGGWLWGPANIVFTTNGGVALDNGHHRLSGVVQSGKDVWMLVVTGAEPAIRAVTDIGLSRTGGDTIKMMGGTEFSNEMGSYAKMLLTYRQTVGTTNPWRPATLTSPGTYTPTQKQVGETWQSEQGIWHTIALAIKASVKFMPKGVPPKTVGAFIYLAEEKYPTEGVTFFQELAAGHHPDVMKLLIRISNNRPSGSGTQLEFDRKVMELLIRAFNAYKAGTSFGRPQTPFILSRIK